MLCAEELSDLSNDLQSSPLRKKSNQFHNGVNSLAHFDLLDCKLKVLVLNVLIILQVLAENLQAVAFVAHYFKVFQKFFFRSFVGQDLLFLQSGQCLYGVQRMANFMVKCTDEYALILLSQLLLL